MISQNKKGEQNGALHSEGTCCIIFTLVSSLRVRELQKHHFTLTEKQKGDISITKADPPRHPTPNRSQTPEQAMEESYLVHNADGAGI